MAAQPLTPILKLILPPSRHHVLPRSSKKNFDLCVLTCYIIISGSSDGITAEPEPQFHTGKGSMENEESENEKIESGKIENTAETANDIGINNEAEKEGKKENGSGTPSKTQNAKESMAAFGKTILSYIDKGVEASKKGLKTAGNAISDFGDKSVNRIELTQLKGRLEKNYADLGKLAYAALKENTPLSSENPETAALVQSISKNLEDIKKHEENLASEKKK